MFESLLDRLKVRRPNGQVFLPTRVIYSEQRYEVDTCRRDRLHYHRRLRVSENARIRFGLFDENVSNGVDITAV
jgi:hypothetical protein